MKNDDLMVMGIAGVAVLLILKGGIKLPSNLQSTFSRWMPFIPDEGQSYNPANPGAYIPLSELINGTIHDYYSSDKSSYRIPTNEQLFTIDGPLDSAKKTVSIIRLPGALW